MKTVLLLLLAAAVLGGLSLMLGAKTYKIGETLSDLDRKILVETRLPRAIAAFLCGFALATAGVAFQGLFRNPLADPFVAGTSGGAALGAVAAIALGLPLTPMAMATAIASAVLVYALARVRGRVPVGNLVLVGFAVGSFASAMVSVVIYLTTRNWNQVLFWLMGSLAHTTWPDVRMLAAYMVVPFVALCVFARPLNAIALGEEQAVPLGVDVERITPVVLFSGAILTAATTALFGAIGFVGLIVPHLLRRLVGPDHRELLPASAVGGGVLVLACDLLARTAAPPLNLPIGALTALLGGPFFIYILRRDRVRW